LFIPLSLGLSIRLPDLIVPIHVPLLTPSFAPPLRCVPPVFRLDSASSSPSVSSALIHTEPTTTTALPLFPVPPPVLWSSA
jgi:hypothetical protein